MFKREESVFALFPGALLRRIAPSGISVLTLAITNRCNLRCRICDIWEQEPAELGPAQIERLLREPFLKGLRYVNFTGGEPFLCGKFEEIYSLARAIHPGSRSIVSSNAVLTGKVTEFFGRQRDLRPLSLEVSILDEGVTQTQGSFRNMNKTLDEVRGHFPQLKVSAKFVITPWNYTRIKEAAGFCKGKNMAVTFKMVENLCSYTNERHYKENEQDKAFGFTQEQLKSISESLQSLPAQTALSRRIKKGIESYIRKGRLLRPCSCWGSSLFVNYEGSIYRCRAFNKVSHIASEKLAEEAASSRCLGPKRPGIEPVCRDCLSIYRFF